MEDKKIGQFIFFFNFMKFFEKIVFVMFVFFQSGKVVLEMMIGQVVRVFEMVNIQVGMDIEDIKLININSDIFFDCNFIEVEMKYCFLFFIGWLFQKVFVG